MYKTILCATDGSESAGKAAALAAQLAKVFDSKLIYLHVAQASHVTDQVRHLAETERLTEAHALTPPDFSRLPSWINQTEEIRLRASEDRRAAEYLGEIYLGRAEHDAKAAGATAVETLIRSGDPASEILEVAEETGADAIVVGARGLSDLKGLFLGSVSHRVSQHAPCTCITVR